MALRKFIIERDIPAVGSLERSSSWRSGEIEGGAASTWPGHSMGQSYVADNKTFCVDLAKDEAIIKKHAEVSGFPATKITEVRKMIDPTTEQAD